MYNKKPPFQSHVKFYKSILGPKKRSPLPPQTIPKLCARNCYEVSTIQGALFCFKYRFNVASCLAPLPPMMYCCVRPEVKTPRSTLAAAWLMVRMVKRRVFAPNLRVMNEIWGKMLNGNWYELEGGGNGMYNLYTKSCGLMTLIMMMMMMMMILQFDRVHLKCHGMSGGVSNKFLFKQHLSGGLVFTSAG